jgi:O-acetylserine/cysteine efflux transporter
MKTSLSLRHFLLALAVVAVWGSNFVVIKLALAHMPPLLFATLRFMVVVLPMVLLLPRPAVPWRNLAAYGLLIGVGQFGLLFVAMNGHISPGLASLVIQVQVFFTIGLALADGRRDPAARAVAGTGAGRQRLGRDRDPHRRQHHSAGPGGWCCWPRCRGRAAIWSAGLPGGSTWWPTWCGRACLPCHRWRRWPCGRRAGTRWWPVWLQADAGAWAAVAWQAWGNSIFGYAAWGWLLSRYSAATITPMALLVPLFGMGSAAWWLGESLPAWKLAAAALVMGGLALNLLWPWWRKRLGAVKTPCAP